MKNDIVEVFDACIDGTLDQIDLQFEDNAAVCVVLASEGYPEKYGKGYPITGLEAFKEQEKYFVFHAGSKLDCSGTVVTNGGRVLGVTAIGRDLMEARENAYEAAEWISFDNKYMRRDIGKGIDQVKKRFSFYDKTHTTTYVSHLVLLCHLIGSSSMQPLVPTATYKPAHFSHVAGRVKFMGIFVFEFPIAELICICVKKMLLLKSAFLMFASRRSAPKKLVFLKLHPDKFEAIINDILKFFLSRFAFLNFFPK